MIITAVEARREARLQLKTRNTRAAKARLRRAKANVHRLVRAALRNFWTKIRTEVQRCSEVGDLRGVYNGIKSAVEPHPVRTASLLSVQGSLIQDPSLQLDRWVEHYSSIYSQEHFTTDALSHVPQLPVLHVLDAEISFSSVKQVVRSLKNFKSSGADGITAEILHCGDDILAAHLYNLLLACWRSQCIPQDLKNAVTVTLYKNKGSQQDCNNYRGISPLSVVGKVLACVILPRFQVLADLILPESQCGFRPHRSTIGMIFTLRQLQEKCLEQRKPLIVVFIDLTKAFDTVCRGGLFAILQWLGCPGTLLSIISGFHNHMQVSVRYNGSISKAFPVTRGVKQGCVLAPTLFAIYFSALLLRAFPSTSGVLLHSRISGKLFNLSHFQARSKTHWVFILHVNCSMPTMRPLLPTVLLVHKYCVILSQQCALTLE